IPPLHALALIRQFRMSAAVALEERHPLRAKLLPASAETFGEVLVDAVGHQKFLLLGPAIGALCQLHLFIPQRLAMSAGGVLLVRRAIADVARHDDQAWPVVDAVGD